MVHICEVMMTKWWLGTIGFGYRDWSGSFYPSELKPRDYLTYYSRRFNSVELDTTFYGTPKPQRIHQWLASVPERFCFCVKTPRKITHEMGLVGVRDEVEKFLSVIQGLGEHLGVVLIQLPPSFTVDFFDRLSRFFIDLPSGLRYAVELRHRSWYNERTLDLLRERGIAWVTLEFPGLPMKVFPTADFLYIRWVGQHGSFNRHTHERLDKTEQLIWWRDQIDAVSNRVKCIFGFFNNDYAGFAAGTCQKFMRILGLSSGVIDAEKQARLF